MKTILILHGWPQYRLESYFLSKHLRDKGYKVVYPNLFDERFEFTLPNLMHKTSEILDGEIPLAIVGISLGGLVLPFIASQYPSSKLIFIATGANMKSKSKAFNAAIFIAQSTVFGFFLNYLLSLSNRHLERFYRLIIPFKGEEVDREEYERDLKANVEFIKTISIKKEVEIINFRKHLDNRLLLKGMKNKSLIFSGEGDMLMPKERGEELHRLLVNSRMVVNRGEHFNVFGPKDLKTVEEFLED